MRQGNNNNRQRSRGRSGRSKGQGQNNPNRAYDSSGPTGRLRGTAVQLAEKYATLAQDARSNKDRVIVEGLLQHAEHYMRIVSEANEAQAKQREQSEANRRQNNEQMADRNDAPQVNGADTAVEQPVSANVSANVNVSAEQPDIDAAGAGDQPGVDESVPVQETPTPVRRQRRSTGQRRSRVAAKTADKAEPMEKAPASAPEAPAEEPAEIPAEIPVATEPSE